MKDKNYERFWGVKPSAWAATAVGQGQPSTEEANHILGLNCFCAGRYDRCVAVQSRKGMIETKS